MDLRQLVERCFQSGVQVSTETPDVKQYTGGTVYGIAIKGDDWATAAGLNCVVETIVQTANHTGRWRVVGEMSHDGTVGHIMLQEFSPVA